MATTRVANIAASQTNSVVTTAGSYLHGVVLSTTAGVVTIYNHPSTATNLVFTGSALGGYTFPDPILCDKGINVTTAAGVVTTVVYSP